MKLPLFSLCILCELCAFVVKILNHKDTRNTKIHKEKRYFASKTFTIKNQFVPDYSITVTIHQP